MIALLLLILVSVLFCTWLILTELQAIRSLLEKGEWK